MVVFDHFWEESDKLRESSLQPSQHFYDEIIEVLLNVLAEYHISILLRQQIVRKLISWVKLVLRDDFELQLHSFLHSWRIVLKSIGIGLLDSLYFLQNADLFLQFPQWLLKQLQLRLLILYFGKYKAETARTRK